MCHGQSSILIGTTYDTFEVLTFVWPIKHIACDLNSCTMIFFVYLNGSSLSTYLQISVCYDPPNILPMYEKKHPKSTNNRYKAEGTLGTVPH